MSVDDRAERDEFILSELEEGKDSYVLADELNLTLKDIWRACGSQGHDYQDGESGDPATPYFSTWRCCGRCGAPDEGSDDL